MSCGIWKEIDEFRRDKIFRHFKGFFQGILTDKGRLDLSARTPALFEPRKEGVS